MRVRVDQQRCIGSGQCVLVEPGVFDQCEDEGYVLLLAERPDEVRRAAVRRAATGCPVGAISVLDD
ncbi:ferredoxin [Nonomuraea zeae]|uniref:Ferredoxin n=1 Tax=Nonomuraea zeae TaxID=1642303 RepID=A0A5S4HCX3_9ACTN|nr:ferredoxin [Nonomuraea zeae]TMR36730.1 ferredoxin [Nonomuraea zeae]